MDQKILEIRIVEAISALSFAKESDLAKDFLAELDAVIAKYEGLVEKKVPEGTRGKISEDLKKEALWVQRQILCWRDDGERFSANSLLDRYSSENGVLLALYDFKAKGIVDYDSTTNEWIMKRALNYQNIESKMLELLSPGDESPKMVNAKTILATWKPMTWSFSHYFDLTRRTGYLLSEAARAHGISRETITGLGTCYYRKRPVPATPAEEIRAFVGDADQVNAYSVRNHFAGKYSANQIAGALVSHGYITADKKAPREQRTFIKKHMAQADSSEK